MNRIIRCTCGSIINERKAKTVNGKTLLPQLRGHSPEVHQAHDPESGGLSGGRVPARRDGAALSTNGRENMKYIVRRSGGWRGVLRGIVEGLILTAYLTAVYYAWKGGFEKQLLILSIGVLIGVGIVALILIIKNKGGY